MAEIERDETEASLALPGGVVTFVFTDIQGSTAMFRRLGDAYPPLLEQHNEILRAVWREHNGAEVKTEGDAFFVAFADPTDAIRASVIAIERLAAHPWPPGDEMLVRIGMHTGVGHPRDGDYIAFPVHQAARIGGVGHGGQVVVSPETADLAADLADIELHDLGSFRVRDFDEPIHLFQAERSPTPTAFAELRTSADVRHNLPADLPTLLGRDDDIAGVTEQLGQSRLVSIVGPGGVGKTLTAQTVALTTAASYADGAWFVDLAAHTDGSTLRGAVADVLAITPDELDEHLRERTLLLVLDNAEQATAEIARLASSMLDAAPGVSLLVTSREPLALASERVWRLNLMDAEAAQALFVERARSADPTFAGDAQADAIRDLCNRLDGLPLAIELAAARVTALSVAEIAASLDDRLRILRSRRRDLDERQRTATGLVDWSYRLLDEDEQLVMRRLGAFAGSFDLDGATVVSEDAGLDRIDIGDIVWSLVEKSLLMPVIGDGSTRYRQLETVRAFGRHQMESDGELESTRRVIAEWYLARFDPQAPFTQIVAIELRDELDSFRSLIGDLVDEAPELAQRLAWSLGLFFKNSDPGRGLAELEPFLDRLGGQGPSLVGLYSIAAHLAMNGNDLETSRSYVDAGMALVSGDERPIGYGAIRNVAALNAIRAGELVEAAEIAAEAQRNAEPLAMISLTNTTGVLAAERGDLEGAAAAFEELVVLADDLGAVDAQVVATAGVAEIAHRRGDLDRALTATASSLRLAAELGLRSQQALGLIGAARLLADVGRWDDAVAIHAGADRVMDETGHTLFEGDRVISEQMYDRAREALGADAFARAESAGTALADLELHASAVAALDETIVTQAVAAT